MAAKEKLFGGHPGMYDVFPRKSGSAPTARNILVRHGTPGTRPSRDHLQIV